MNAQVEFLNEQKKYFEKLGSVVKKSYQAVANNVSFTETQLAMIDDAVVTEITNLTETPTFVTGATLRDYQLHGVSTLCSWFLRGVGGILADEMGLGKTLQTIALIGCLKFKLGISGPHLIVVPLAVIQNWYDVEILCTAIVIPVCLNCGFIQSLVCQFTHYFY
jgi:SNF2 family DNA or RNA helicase